MTEAELLSWVIDVARMLQWRILHIRPARTNNGKWRTPVQGGGVGFPDCLLLKGSRGLALELKTEKGRVRPEQNEWLAAFEATGWTAMVIRPSDRETLQKLLSRP